MVRQRKLSGPVTFCPGFLSIHANRTHNKLPAYSAKFEGVLMMVLNGKWLPFGDNNFVAAALASINSRIRGGSAARILFIKLDMLGLNKKTSVLKVRHDC